MTWRGWVRRIAVVVLVTAVSGVASTLPANAEPGSEAGGVSWGANAAAVPEYLRHLVPGSDEFNERYYSNVLESGNLVELPRSAGMSQERSAGCQATVGGDGGQGPPGEGPDIGLYVIDVVRRIGSVIDEVSRNTGADIGIDTTPWPGEKGLEFRAASEDGVMPLTHYYYDSTGKSNDAYLLPEPVYLSSCSNDLAQYGKPNSDSYWGFDFYAEPDPGFDAFFEDRLKHPQYGYDMQDGRDVHSQWESWQFLASEYDGVSGFSPTDYRSFCSTGEMMDNPFCITAMFLHCPDYETNRDTTDASVINCWFFNMNTVLLNQQLGWWIDKADPGSGWRDVIFYDVNSPLFGALLQVLGPITWAAGGLVTVSLALWGAGKRVAESLWGVITCSTEIDKCLAEAAARSLTQSADLVTAAAAHPATPNLAAYSGLLNKLAGVSALAMLIILFLTMCFVVLTGKRGVLMHALLGVVQWGIAIGAGAALLTMAYQIAGYVADAIAGTGGSSGALIGLSDGVSVSALVLGGFKTIQGWLIVAFVSVLGVVAAIIVWLILTLSNQFIPLAIGMMILQVAGLTGGETLRRWVSRGWGAMWTIILLRPAVTLLAKFAEMSGAAAEASAWQSGLVSDVDAFASFIGGVVMLILCALAPWLVVKMFPVAAQTGMGAIAGLMAATNVTMSATRAGKGVMSRSDAAQRLAAGRSGGGPTAASASGGSGAGGAASSKAAGAGGGGAAGAVAAVSAVRRVGQFFGGVVKKAGFGDYSGDSGRTGQGGPYGDEGSGGADAGGEQAGRAAPDGGRQPAQPEADNPAVTGQTQASSNRQPDGLRQAPQGTQQPEQGPREAAPDLGAAAGRGDTASGQEPAVGPAAQPSADQPAPPLADVEAQRSLPHPPDSAPAATPGQEAPPPAQQPPTPPVPQVAPGGSVPPPSGGSDAAPRPGPTSTTAPPAGELEPGRADSGTWAGADGPEGPQADDQGRRGPSWRGE